MPEAEPDQEEEDEEEEEPDQDMEAVMEHADDDTLLRGTSAHTEAFDAEMKERLRANVDRFDDMVGHEEQIRLGEDGWKQRYYKVCGAGHHWPEEASQRCACEFASAKAQI